MRGLLRFSWEEVTSVPLNLSNWDLFTYTFICIETKNPNKTKLKTAAFTTLIIIDPESLLQIQKDHDIIENLIAARLNLQSN